MTLQNPKEYFWIVGFTVDVQFREITVDDALELSRLASKDLTLRA